MNRLSLPALRSPAYTFILSTSLQKHEAVNFCQQPSGLRHSAHSSSRSHALSQPPRSFNQRNTTVKLKTTWSSTQHKTELGSTQYNTEPDTQDTNLFSSKGKFMYHGHKLKIKVLLLPSTIQRLLSRACRSLLHGNQGVLFCLGVFPHFKN